MLFDEDRTRTHLNATVRWTVAREGWTERNYNFAQRAKLARETVNFITEEELKKYHSEIPHGGSVIRTGKTGFDGSHNHVVEFSLKLDSNPEFTSCVITAYARAAYKMAKEGMSGCKTVFDIPPAYLSAKSGEELRKEML